MKTNGGQVTLYGIMTLWCCSLLLIYQLNHMINAITQIKNRIQVYLCYRHQNSQQNAYLFKMANANRGIELLNLLSLIPPLTATAQEGKTALIHLQWAIHLAYLKKMFTNPYCDWWQKTYYVKNLPYLNRNLIFLERDTQQLLILKAIKWSNFIKSKDLYGIKVQYMLEDIFQTKTSAEFYETSLRELAP